MEPVSVGPGIECLKHVYLILRQLDSFYMAFFEILIQSCPEVRGMIPEQAFVNAEQFLFFADGNGNEMVVVSAWFVGNH